MNRRRTQPVSVVVRCGDDNSKIWDTVHSVERQLRRPAQVALVVEPATPPGTRTWAAAVVRQRGWQLVEAPSARPAVMKNAGIQATTAPFVTCVNAGDELHNRFLDQAVGVLIRRKTVAVVTSWVEHVGPGLHAVSAPTDVSLVDCLSQSDIVHDASLFRRADWSARGGFDETLPALDDLDLWLGLLGDRKTVVVLPEALLSRDLAPDALWRPAGSASSRGQAMERVFDKHQAAFESHVEHVLACRERSVLEAMTKVELARQQEAVDQARLAESGATRERILAALAIDNADVREDRGGPSRSVVDDYESAFFDASRAEVRGRVMSLYGDTLARRVGEDRLECVDVADPAATDLRCAANLPSAAYDCILLPRPACRSGDLSSMVAECARLLKAGGVLLATLSLVASPAASDGAAERASQLSADDARRLFAAHFGPLVTVTSYGNLGVTEAARRNVGTWPAPGLSTDLADPRCPTLVAVRAVRR